MSYKRSRSDFEADNFVVYGTPLPPLDPDVRDDGSYVPVWKQEAVDERGRKRFHGAFTGGFSAGYFNTVGSKEGWTPATFVSSRSNRAKDLKDGAQPRPEDFMDEEDLAEQEQAKQLITNEAFSGIGTTNDDSQRRGALVDLVRPKASMGSQLLQKMGWKPGQGIGPKVRRIADGDTSEHLFAPEDSKMLVFVRKTDHRGLGRGETNSQPGTRPSHTQYNDEDDEEAMIASSRSRYNKTHEVKKKSAFGVGVLNDDGSDDEDPFELGPKISYNRSVGSTKKPKRIAKSAGLVTSSANPLLASKPVFLPKKKIAATVTFAKCHDGRLPLDGYILASKGLDNTASGKYLPPRIPEGWVSMKKPADTQSTNQTSYRSTVDAAKDSKLNPTSRASFLGEAQLPGKSIFDFLTPAARDQLVNASGKPNLPAALGEALPPEFTKTAEEEVREAWRTIPDLDPVTAKAALSRGDGGGFMPYADDEAKRARYRSFLEFRSGSSAEEPQRANGSSIDEWSAELREFTHAAQVFRPMTGLMASRFTSSSNSSSIDKASHTKPQDPAEEAAKMKMYGPMTRSVMSWTPSRLLCKRFGVRPPAVDDSDMGENGNNQTQYASSRSEVPPVASMEIIQKVKDQSKPSHNPWKPSQIEQKSDQVTVNAERNEALEVHRPGDAVFKAIFGSDDEDDD